MPKINVRLQSDFSGLTANDFIVETCLAADKQEPHIAFQGEVLEYIVNAPRRRKFADELEALRDSGWRPQPKNIAGGLAGQNPAGPPSQRLSHCGGFKPQERPSILENGGYAFISTSLKAPAVKNRNLATEVTEKD